MAPVADWKSRWRKSDPMFMNKDQEKASNNQSRMISSLGTASLVSILKRPQNSAEAAYSGTLASQEVTVKDMDQGGAAGLSDGWFD